MKNVKNEKGFSLIELIVVITLIGIVSAVLIPQFSVMTLRDRMATDIDSVKTVQGQMEIYYAHYNRYPGNNIESIMSTLLAGSYVSPKYLSQSTVKLKTEGAEMVYDPLSSQVKLKVTPYEYIIFNNTADKANWLSK